MQSSSCQKLLFNEVEQPSNISIRFTEEEAENAALFAARFNAAKRLQSFDATASRKTILAAIPKYNLCITAAEKKQWRQEYFGTGRHKSQFANSFGKKLAPAEVSKIALAGEKYIKSLGIKTKGVFFVWRYLCAQRHLLANATLYPSHDTIASDSCCCEKTVRLALQQLFTIGLVDWTHRIERKLCGDGIVRVRRKSNVYTLKSWVVAWAQNKRDYERKKKLAHNDNKRYALPTTSKAIINAIAINSQQPKLPLLDIDNEATQIIRRMQSIALRRIAG